MIHRETLGRTGSLTLHEVHLCNTSPVALDVYHSADITKQIEVV